MKSNSTTNNSDLDAIEISLEKLRGLPLPEYSDDAHKADYGKLLLIAGSKRLPGAAILAARAALRVGVGTVRLAAPQSIASAIGIAVPELMIIPLPETSTGTLALDALTLLQAQYDACDAAVLGPGLDENEETSELLKALAHEIPLPCVLDASAILALVGEKAKFAAPRIFTPHLQEMSALLGHDPKDIANAREKTTLEFARDWKSVLVLKGHETLIAGPKTELYKNLAGTRGLGTAGSGDVLAGIIGGLLTQMTLQKIEASRAAIWGVHLHALAGEACEKDFGDDGMTASDLLSRLPGVLRYARKQTEGRKEGERTGLRQR